MKLVLQLLALIVLATVPASAMSAEFAEAGRQETQNLRWRSPVIRIAVSTSLTSQNSSVKADSDVLGAVQRSIAAWQSITGLEFRVETTDRKTVSPTGSAGDVVSLITIAQTPDNLQLFASDPFGESARTRVFYNRRGAITEGDIVLNPLQQFSTDGTYGTFDLETTLSHEIGHLLGLKHSAVTGSIMSERIPRNSDVYLGPRLPTETDVAAARDLYGVENGSCCGAISGKLGSQAKPLKSATVWAEDAQGRVVAQTETSADGSYRLGGLPDAKYQLFWQRRDAGGSVASELGSATIENASQASLSKRVSQDQTDLSIDYVGLDLQPSDAAVVLRPGRQYSICLAGHGLAEATSVSFSTKLIRADVASIARPSFGDKIDAVSLSVTVDAETPAGVYTLYAEGRDGVRSAAVGTIIVTK